MKLYNLKPGMILINRLGAKYLVLPLSGHEDELYAYALNDSSRSALSRWDMNLYSKAGVTDDDIIEIQALESFQDMLVLEDMPAKLIWKRPNQAELMSQLQELMLQMQGVLELLN